ncbi:hypothetical protein Flavo103_32040 [Flavobacterium collinsii]|uniref:hypothetical protein n=1 Tax=Flavobacterium collinsii TaxID=1114861 RepID=UPI0022BDB471|nr:hypothetical protein [Flavobacterium collinsii]GIQ60068.1 hypothetical protein Flavo103_32040 [Flavobacterium collinsii]
MKTFCLTLIFLGISILGIEIANDFTKTKIFYASFNPQKYYHKDILVVSEKIPPMNSSSNKTSWIFYGYCKSDKLKSGITISKSIIENQNTSQIPIWRISSVKNKIIYRRKNNIINSPFSYEMRDYWSTPIFILAAISAQFYYITIKRKERKNTAKQT